MAIRRMPVQCGREFGICGLGIRICGDSMGFEAIGTTASNVSKLVQLVVMSRCVARCPYASQSFAK